MDKKENDALSSTNSNASLTTLTATTIPQQPSTNQVFPDGGLSKKRSMKNRKALSPTAKVPSLAIKIYVEQLLYGWDYTCQVIRNTDKNEFHIIAVCHNRDTYCESGSFWKPAYEKWHYHIIFRCVDRKKRIRVSSVLKQLGIRFRPGLDDILWSEHGVETVGNFAEYATYLTHETEKAIRDGKELYEMTELVSNLSIDEIREVRSGYIRLADGTHKVTTSELVELDDTAYRLGYDLKNFSAWYDTLSFTVRSNAKMKTIRESYERGVNARIEENSTVQRLCVFIQGEPNTGKTFASKKALSGNAILTVEGGGTGKFDNLRPDHNAIIISDDVCPNLLNMTDNYVCRAYKRQKNNPAWAGEYFIVTSNLSFEDWLSECKINIRGKHFSAMLSRFYVCEIKAKEDGTNYLALKSASDRGSIEEQTKRADMFMNFQKKFNEIMADYRPTKNKIDYSLMIDKSFQQDEENSVESEGKTSWQSDVNMVPIFIEEPEKLLSEMTREDWNELFEKRNTHNFIFSDMGDLKFRLYFRKRGLKDFTEEEFRKLGVCFTGEDLRKTY